MTILKKISVKLFSKSPVGGAITLSLVSLGLVSTVAAGEAQSRRQGHAVVNFDYDSKYQSVLPSDVVYEEVIEEIIYDPQPKVTSAAVGLAGKPVKTVKKVHSDADGSVTEVTTSYFYHTDEDKGLPNQVAENFEDEVSINRLASVGQVEEAEAFIDDGILEDESKNDEDEISFEDLENENLDEEKFGLKEPTLEEFEKEELPGGEIVADDILADVDDEDLTLEELTSLDEIDEVETLDLDETTKDLNEGPITNLKDIKISNKSTVTEKKGTVSEAETELDQKLKMPETNIVGVAAFFERGSSRLSAESKSQLVRVATVLKMHNSGWKMIHLDGIADKGKSFDSNLKLAKKRVRSVLNSLLAEGVQRKKIRARGFSVESAKGKKSALDHAQNRRVDMTVSGVDGDSLLGKTLYEKLEPVSPEVLLKVR